MTSRYRLINKSEMVYLVFISTKSLACTLPVRDSIYETLLCVPRHIKRQNCPLADFTIILEQYVTSL